VYFVWGIANEIDRAVLQWRQRPRADRAVVGEEDAILGDEPGDLPCQKGVRLSLAHPSFHTKID
jgi:hypothetical protein